jgi:hypothetical protein
MTANRQRNLMLPTIQQAGELVQDAEQISETEFFPGIGILVAVGAPEVTTVRDVPLQQ